MKPKEDYVAAVRELGATQLRIQAANRSFASTLLDVLFTRIEQGHASMVRADDCRLYTILVTEDIPFSIAVDGAPKLDESGTHPSLLGVLGPHDLDAIARRVVGNSEEEIAEKLKNVRKDVAKLEENLKWFREINRVNK